MTAAKFKPLIFSVLGFALSNISNIFIFMILDDFCLLPALFCYVIINVWNLESHMQIADQCAPREFANCAENLILSALQLQEMSFCRKFPGGTSISHYRHNQGFVEGQFNVSWCSGCPSLICCWLVGLVRRDPMEIGAAMLCAEWLDGRSFEDWHLE
jgi:hypothetical protein